MDRKDISELEHILFDESAEPKPLPLSLLKHITSGFSDEKKIGHGGFAVVYKGMLDNGMVAVKKLRRTLDMDEKQFSQEVHCLMKAKHKNIVRFLGYCSDTQGEMVDYEGELVLADVRERLLCFEYLSQGSLDKQITDASCGLGWEKRYQIINGICEGLYYLHQNHILHLDLKPANILLDDNMVPKIADFGTSRFFNDKQSGVTTSSMIGTIGYLAPESYGGRKITFKLDIYSLGIIIIDILTGEKGYPDVDNVLERWRNRLEKTQGDTQLVQVRVCTELAIQCTESDPAKRPDTRHIIDRLGATKSKVEFATDTVASSSSSVLQVSVLRAVVTIGLQNTMANEVKASTERLYSIPDQNLRFSSMPENSSNVQHIANIRETVSDVEEALIIGRTEEKQKTIATLSESLTPEFTVLPIYGIGGIGKTTLAQLIFNDSRFAGYSRVWVYVSQNLDLNKIGNSIISQLSEASHVAEKQILHNQLRKLLAGKKILIVLDDVWEMNPDTLKTLKTMLRLGSDSMVTVIVTTRDEAIARKICHTVEPYKLETLTHKMCWTIIKQKTAFKDRADKKQLKHIGKEIAAKCGGVALAAQSLGYTLNGKTSDEWESVRDNYIWNISPSEDPSSRDHEVLASLMLSYSYMPEWLKLCFSYCTIFRKGHNIVKYDLIHQWIALGFIEPSGVFDSMQLCEKYVTQLLGMSFLQYSKTSSSDARHDKDATLFTMHDLVHDLAREILADQFNDKGNAGGNRYRYALLTDCSKPLQLFVTSPANIKVLYFLDCGKLELCDNAFSLATCLHVLDLSECLIQKLPDSICQLRHLRYLRAPMIQDRMIPDCITGLSELNYLNLRGSHNISALPESIGDMEGLMHLDLSGCKGIRKLPMSFEELKTLVYLDLSHCDMPISKAFCGFTKLRYLNLSSNYQNLRGLTKVIGNLANLRYLNLSDCMDFMASTKEQVKGRTRRLLDSIGTLSNLEHLDLSMNNELSSIPESIGNLRKLHTLNLLGCFRVRKLPHTMVKMVSLKVLNVETCVELDESMLSLLNIALLPHFEVHTSSDKCSSNISRLRPTNPVELTIDRLENVKSAEEAQSVKLIEKQKIEVLNFFWTVDARRFVDDKEVLEKLVPPNSVRKFYINGYMSASFPDWLMGMRLYLPNLNKIYLCDFPMCKHLPPLGQLPNLGCLTVCRMGSLEEWNTAYGSGEEGANELMFPKLETLTIEQCAKLRIPCLPRAKSLSIQDCDSVLSSLRESSSQHSGATSYSPITVLYVNDSKVPLHQWKLLHQLPILHSLTIECCSDLKASPEIIQHLSSLRSLTLKYLDQSELPRWMVELTYLQELCLVGCGNMTSLPQWIGQLASLVRFEIKCCCAIMSLPESMQLLTNLSVVELHSCPTLWEWCESMENKMKLGHIRVTRNRSGNTRKEDIAKNTNKVDVSKNLAASIHGTKTGEVHPDLYTAVMNMPGFTEEALSRAVSHLMDNNAQGSAYMGMEYGRGAASIVARQLPGEVLLNVNYCTLVVIIFQGDVIVNTCICCFFLPVGTLMTNFLTGVRRYMQHNPYRRCWLFCTYCSVVVLLCMEV